MQSQRGCSLALRYMFVCVPVVSVFSDVMWCDVSYQRLVFRVNTCTCVVQCGN